MEPREYQILFQVESEHWWYRALHKNILKALRNYFREGSNIHVLDAGCGTGLFLEKLQQGSHATGIDYSEDAIKFCHQRRIQSVARASVEKLPFADRTFNVITSADVLYHKNVLSDQQALNEFYRVLKPEGIIILNLPAFEFLRSSHDQAIHTERRYTKSELQFLMERSKFQIQKLYYRNSLLFPLIALIRILRKGKVRSHSDVVLPSKIVNEILTRILFMDDWFSRKIPFLAGLSIFCVARKK